MRYNMNAKWKFAQLQVGIHKVSYSRESNEREDIWLTTSKPNLLTIIDGTVTEQILT